MHFLIIGVRIQSGRWLKYATNGSYENLECIRTKAQLHTAHRML